MLQSVSLYEEGYIYETLYALDLEKNELVCFVGAGGKTGLMQKLLGECAQQGGRVRAETLTGKGSGIGKILN